MASEVHNTFINYYEYLNIPQNAPLSVIQRAFDNLVASTNARMNNPLTWHNALHIHNTIEPAIRQHLLSGDTARAEYDRQFVAYQKKLAQQDEPADNEGLDDELKQPFFFDPYDGYDTETPALSLRQIGMKLDNEWPHARAWITDMSDESHVFVGFLTLVAGRRRLAQRIEQIINAVSRTKSMDINEGIERSIDILDPKIERPTVDVQGISLGDKMFHAGDFISDLPAQSELTLSHNGIRGCVFGTVESRTSWARFQDGQSTIRFALMPEGTEKSIGPSEIKVPLFFQVSNLPRNADHTAELVVRMENQDSVFEFPVYVQIHVLPLPPRVSFDPPATQAYPAWAGISRCGIPTSVVVVPRNAGDEGLVPLVGRISTHEPGASANLERFRANQPITLTIDTSNRPYGKVYDVEFFVDYGRTSGARGPTTLYARGETLPTAWQSMLRQKQFSERLGIGFIVGLLGFLLLGALGTGLAAHVGIAWLLFFAVPILPVLATRSVTRTIVAHIQRSGDANVRMENIPPWMLWGIPAGGGFLLALICLLTSDPGSSFLIGGFVGFLVGFGSGFIIDQVQLSKAASPPQLEA
jgi:hypothetical protein